MDKQKSRKNNPEEELDKIVQEGHLNMLYAINAQEAYTKNKKGAKKKMIQLPLPF